MRTKKEPEKNQSEEDIGIPDPVKFSKAMAEVYEKSLPLMREFYEKNFQDFSNKPFDPFNIRDTYAEFLEKIAENPGHYMQLQSEYWQNWMQIWQESMLKFLGEPSKEVIKADPKDRRFRDKEWQENAVFDFIKQSYLLTCQWMHKTIEETDGLSLDEKRKLEFYTELYANALSPTNFVLTNPEVLKETIHSGGENLIKGMHNLLEDFKRGHGELDISTTNTEVFKLGENIATTPGKVIYQNDLMQLIQYEATTKDVHKIPVLIIPPWINKFYILDLKEENSFIKWLVDQGYTVFTISWVNPDKKLAQKRFEDYMDEGVLSAIKQIEEVTGVSKVNTIGYCLGGTLLSITLAYLATKKKADNIASATFFTTLIDFEHAGDLKLFMDDAQLELMDRAMAESGVLESKQLQKTFSLLRSNDMIWSFVINNYLMGKEPFPFDLLYWNDDATNMPAAMHSFYMRKMYRDNLLREPGGVSMYKTKIDISKIKTPAYFLSTKEDHIAPWVATYSGSTLLGGDVTFTLAASGHTAGVVNHPAKNKYCYWTNNKLAAQPSDWLAKAKEHEGSWWPHWEKWLRKKSGDKIKARKIGKSLEDAPGSYVKKRSK
ncbi:MAG: PHA/PHB synthase family protein [Alphaproteobacteria bacterium]